MTEKELDSNYSLFESADSPISKSGNKLDVVKLSFDHAELMTWQELFSGFDHLYAITFSSGINFLYYIECYRFLIQQKSFLGARRYSRIPCRK